MHGLEAEYHNYGEDFGALLCHIFYHLNGKGERHYRLFTPLKLPFFKLGTKVFG